MVLRKSIGIEVNVFLLIYFNKVSIRILLHELLIAKVILKVSVILIRCILLD